MTVAAPVDIVINNADGTSVTFTGGFGYSTNATAPTLDPGPPILLTPQMIQLPFPPSLTVPTPSIQATTNVVFTPGVNNGSPIFAWTQLTGPLNSLGVMITAEISDNEALNPTLEFPLYNHNQNAGTYTFQLTATVLPTNGAAAIVVTTIVTVIYPLTVLPKVVSGSVQALYADASAVADLNPKITDDGWGGPLTSVWTLISSPVDAAFPIVAPPQTLNAYTSGIFDPAVFDPNIFDVVIPAGKSAAATITASTNLTGVYVYQVQVSRAWDNLVGTGTWRVVVIGTLPVTPTVITSTPVPPVTGPDGEVAIGVGPPNPEYPTSLFINGVAFDVIISSCQITNPLYTIPSCTFKMYAGRFDPDAQFGQDGYGDTVPISYGDDIVLSRATIEGGNVSNVILFAGICMSCDIEFADSGAIPMFTATVTGYAWHLTRGNITQAFSLTPIDQIVKAIMALAPGNIGTQYVDTGLPLATIAFNDIRLDAALTQLASKIHYHWRVDYGTGYGSQPQLHFCFIETQNDPAPLTPSSTNFRNLKVKWDLSQSINRVYINYDNVIVVPILIDAQQEVPSLGGQPQVVDGHYVLDINGKRVVSDPMYPPPVNKITGQPVPLPWTASIQPTLWGLTVPQPVAPIDQLYYGNNPLASSPLTGGQEVLGAATVDPIVVTYTGVLQSPQAQIQVTASPIVAGGGQMAGPYSTGPVVMPARTIIESGAVIPAYTVYSYIALSENHQYFLTFVTPDGETGPIASCTGQSGGGLPPPTATNESGFPGPEGTFSYLDQIDPKYLTNAISIRVIDSGGVNMKKVSGINVYRQVGASIGGMVLVGSISPMGGEFIDTLLDANVPLSAPILTVTPDQVSTVDALQSTVAYYLEGCQAYYLLHIPSQVMSEDQDAQEALAALLMTGDGVIQASYKLGSMSPLDAQAAADQFIEDLAGAHPTTTFESTDDLMQPGQYVSINLPAPIGALDVKIQSTSVTGFELTVPHWYQVTAADDLFTVEDFVKYLVPGVPIQDQ